MVASSYTHVAGPLCPAPKQALMMPGVGVYGGRKSLEADFLGFDLIVRINEGTPDPFPMPVYFNDEAEAELPKELLTVKMPPVLHIVWPDFGEPPLQADWWKNLYSFLRKKGGEALEKDKTKPYRAIFYCIGGRGRTGTALSILAGLYAKEHLGKKKLKKFDPVEFIRKTYCPEAVESNQQLDYIEAMTGLKVRSLSSFEMRYSAKEMTKKGSANVNGTTYTQTSWDSLADNINDTHYVTIDDNGVIYVNGKLYVGKQELSKERIDGHQADVFGIHRIIDLDTAKVKGASLYPGLVVPRFKDETTPEHSIGNSTPDYEGPAHRLPISQ